MSVTRVNGPRRVLSRWFSSHKLKNEQKKEDEPEQIGRLAKAAIIQLSLHLPLEDQQNRYAKKAQAKSMSWISQYEIITDKKALERVSASAFGIFMAKAHPRCSKRRLFAISLFVNWLFFYDDDIEKRQNREEIRSLHKRTLKILNGDRVQRGDSPIMKGLHNVVHRIDEINRSNTWKRRLISEVGRYCKATYWELNNRLKGAIPTQKEYMLHRPYTSATLVMFLFILFAEKIRLTKEEYKMVKKIADCAAWIVNLLNDILSARKEKESKDIHNIIFSIKNDRHCSYAEAFEETVNLLKAKLSEFDDHRQIARMRGGAVDIYVNGLWEWINAHDLWARDSARYHSYFF